MTEAQARRDLVEAGRRLTAEGLVARSWGNLSLRLDGERMLVTPSGILWSDLTEAMLSVVDLETGEWRGDWKPSGERKVHREIYRRRPEVTAVVHTHQNAASVCAAARVGVPFGSATVNCAPYALPGTKALTLGTVDALGDGSAVLMANHGVFTVGTSMDQAFERIQELERVCADLVERNGRGLPGRTDTVWNPAWLSPLPKGCGGAPAWMSQAPFTQTWCQQAKALPALLDDLAQLAGSRVNVAKALPARAPKNDVVLVRDHGALVCGPDAEALAMVVEKACRAALGGQALGGAHAFPAWEASLMRFVYKQAYSRQAARKAPSPS